MTTPHLLLIDGLNLVRPIYETNPSEDPEKKREGVVKTVGDSFIRAIETHRPTHVAWVFESRGVTWRHLLYPGYKASRPAPPEVLLDAVRDVRANMADQGVATIEYPNLEADDVIGCIAMRAAAAGIAVTVLSTDKDMPYLLKFGVKVYNHFNRSYRDEAWCLAKMFVRPEQMLDSLALQGDSTDDIPGVDQIGVKTAGKLLTEFGDLEGVLAAAAEGKIKGAKGKMLVEQAHMARLSRQLTDLKMDCITEPLSLAAFKVKAKA